MVLSWSFKRESLNKAASELNNTPVGYFFFPLDYLERDSEQSLVIEAFHKAINSGTEDLNHDDSLNVRKSIFYENNNLEVKTSLGYRIPSRVVFILPKKNFEAKFNITSLASFSNKIYILQISRRARIINRKGFSNEILSPALVL